MSQPAPADHEQVVAREGWRCAGPRSSCEAFMTGDPVRQDFVEVVRGILS